MIQMNFIQSYHTIGLLETSNFQAFVINKATANWRGPASVDAAALRLLEVVSCRQHMPANGEAVQRH